MAEGVEDPDQADWLVDEQCGLAQGYLWSRPVDTDGVRRLLADQGLGHSLGPDRAIVPAVATPVRLTAISTK